MFIKCLLKGLLALGAIAFIANFHMSDEFIDKGWWKNSGGYCQAFGDVFKQGYRTLENNLLLDENKKVVGFIFKKNTV